MRSQSTILSIAVSIVFLAAVFGSDEAHSEVQGANPSSSPDFAPGRLIVKVEENAPADTVADLNEKNGATTEEKLPELDMSVVDLPLDLSVAEAMDAYEDSPNVAYAEPDYELHTTATPNDPRFPEMYALNNTGQTVNGVAGTPDADIDAPQAWDSSTGEGVVVAVIDTGMDIKHPDLRDSVWTNPDEIANNNVDDDRNGYVDDVHGWDFVHDDSSVFDSATDDRHATHVGGTIAAEGNNGVGVAGVASQAEVMPLKFIGPKNIGKVSDAIEALNYAVAEGVKISNNSYAFSDNCNGCYAQSLHDAIKAADQRGHLFIAAAANGGEDGIGDDNDSKGIYPASYDSPNIIAVAATNSEDELTKFSNYGATSVDIAAPGINVLSTFPGKSYGYGLGTSMATPHVAGVAALIKSKYPSLTDAGIKDRIMQSADQKPSLAGKVVTGGRLNAVRAVAADPSNTAPEISDTRPTRKQTRDRTPTIAATALDQETELNQTDIELYVDGKAVSVFSYDPATDTLQYTSKKLSAGRHSVKAVARDDQGLYEASTWSFKVVS